MRTTRLESVLLGLIQDKAGLRALKQGLGRHHVVPGGADAKLVEQIDTFESKLNVRRPMCFSGPL